MDARETASKDVCSVYQVERKGAGVSIHLIINEHKSEKSVLKEIKPALNF